MQSHSPGPKHAASKYQAMFRGTNGKLSQMLYTNDDVGWVRFCIAMHVTGGGGRYEMWLFCCGS